MPNFVKIILLLLLVVLVFHFVTEAKFKRLAGDLVAQVKTQRAPMLHDGMIPPIILKFVQRANVDPLKLAKYIELEQVADMRLEKGGDWQALTAIQVISTGEAGFVWVAEQPFGILTKFRVIDALVAGKGQLNVRIMGSIPMVDSYGIETDIAEAMRYLAELVWAPDAMIGNADLKWRVVTERSVYVWMELAFGAVGVTFRFDEVGDIVEVFAEDRPAEIVDGKAVLRDWRITISDYEVIEGRRIPTKGEVGYVYDDGYEAYWRGEIVDYKLADVR